MTLPAACANLAWLALGAPAALRFHRALQDPAGAQWRVLRANLRRNADSAYGRAHGFGTISSAAEFARQVPLARYEDLEPWIARIQAGELSVLTCESVTRLLPTSGSSGARKLIPFTAGLQREFNAGISPWMLNLARRYPSVAFGPAYWSVTPALLTPSGPPSAVPVGFDDDSQYLGGTLARLVDSAMAVPAAVRHISDLTAFRHAILLCLLRRADLRLVSVWHPSYLTLLLDALPDHWEWLLTDLAAGTFHYADRLPPSVTRALRLRPNHRAVERLRRADPRRPGSLWPALRVVSCWADGHAAAAAVDLRRRLPHVTIQPKGLLATEALVTIPFADTHPVAVCSHYYEFIDESGGIHPAAALHAGSIYETVVTTGGGLWRYRLGDLVEVTGWVGRTPALRFLGRAGRVSDLRGEKLSDAFVTKAINDALAPNLAPPFATLAPVEDARGWHYTLFLQADPDPALGRRLDAALRANPHYALCQDLQQLGPVVICPVAEGAYAAYVSAEMARGLRLGDVKPTALSLQTDWERHFVPR